VTAEPYGPRRAVRVGLDRDLQAVLRQAFGQPLAPLDHGDRAGCVRVEIQVVHLADAAEPVGVRVHQRGPGSGQRRMDPGDDEGRRGDRPAHPESLADALHQGRLARPERTGQDHQVSGAQPGGQLAAQVAHGGVGGDAQFGRHAPRSVRKKIHRSPPG
jgi:hypothetical protein